jgi:hypothetical protein
MEGGMMVRPFGAMGVDASAARIDRRNDEPRARIGDERGHEGGKRRYADHRNPGGKPDRTRGRDADAKPGEAARADRDGNLVQRREAALDARHDAVEHGQERLGVPPLKRDGLGCERRDRAPVQNADRTLTQRRIDGENAHP